MTAPETDVPWAPWSAEKVDEVLGESGARWWLSGGVALDRWLGAPIRERTNIDISTVPACLDDVIGALPAGFSAWAHHDDTVTAWGDVPPHADVQPVRVRDDRAAAWVLQINVEDGTDSAWLYRRDPRLQLPWDRAIDDSSGVPTGAPEVQLVWKALRPRPEDDLDKNAVLPALSPDARAWWERAILSIHPHSSWSIPVRSPLFPAKASWNRPTR